MGITELDSELPVMMGLPSQSSSPQILAAPDVTTSSFMEDRELEAQLKPEPDIEPSPEALALRAAFVAYCRGHEWRPGAPPSTLLPSSSPHQGPISTSGGLYGSPSTSSLATASPLSPTDPGSAGYSLGLSHWMRIWTDLGLTESQGGPVAGAVLQTVHAAYRPHNSSRLSYLAFAQACVALSGQLRYDLLRHVGRHGAALLSHQRHQWRLHQLVQLQAHGPRSTRPLRSSWAGDEDMPDGKVDLTPQEVAKEEAIFWELQEIMQQEQQRQQQGHAAAAAPLAGWSAKAPPPPPPPIPPLPDPLLPPPLQASPPQAFGGSGGSGGGGGCGCGGGTGRLPVDDAATVAASKGGGRSPARPPRLQQQQQKQASVWMRGSVDAAAAAANPYLQVLPRSKHYPPQLKPLRLAPAGDAFDLRAYADGSSPPRELRDPWVGGGSAAAADDSDTHSAPLSRGRGARGLEGDLAAFPMSSGATAAGLGTLRSPGSGRAGDGSAVRLPALQGASRLGPDDGDENGTAVPSMEARSSGGAGGAAVRLAAGNSRPGILLASLSGIGGGGAVAAASAADVGGAVTAGGNGSGSSQSASAAAASASPAAALLARVERLERSAVSQESRISQAGSRLRALEAKAEAEARQAKRVRDELATGLVQHFEARQASLEQHIQLQQQQLLVAVQAAEAARMEAVRARAEATAAKADAALAADQVRAGAAAAAREVAMRGSLAPEVDAPAAADSSEQAAEILPPVPSSAAAAVSAVVVVPRPEELAAAVDAAVAAFSEKVLGPVRAELDERLRTVSYQLRKLDEQFSALADQQQQLLADAARMAAEATTAAAAEAASGQLAAVQEGARSSNGSGGGAAGASDTDDVIAALALDMAMLREELRCLVQAGAVVKGFIGDNAALGPAGGDAADDATPDGGGEVERARAVEAAKPAAEASVGATKEAETAAAAAVVAGGCPDAADLRILVERLRSEVEALRDGAAGQAVSCKEEAADPTAAAEPPVAPEALEAPEAVSGAASRGGCRLCGRGACVSADDLREAVERWQAALATQREDLKGQLTGVAREVAAATNAAAAAMAAAASAAAAAAGKGPVPDLRQLVSEPAVGGLKEAVSDLQARVLELEVEVGKAVKLAKSAHAAACTAAAVAASGGVEVALQLGDTLDVQPVQKLCKSVSELEGRLLGLGNRLTMLEMTATVGDAAGPSTIASAGTAGGDVVSLDGTAPSRGANSAAVMARLEALEAEVARATSALAAVNIAAAAAAAAEVPQHVANSSTADEAPPPTDKATPDTGAPKATAVATADGAIGSEDEPPLATAVTRLNERLDDLQQRLDELAREHVASGAKAAAEVEELRRRSSLEEPFRETRPPRGGSAGGGVGALLTADAHLPSKGTGGAAATCAASEDQSTAAVMQQNREADVEAEMKGTAPAGAIIASEVAAVAVQEDGQPMAADGGAGTGDVPLPFIGAVAAAPPGGIDSAGGKVQELTAAVTKVLQRLDVLEAASAAATVAAADSAVASVGEEAAAASPPLPPDVLAEVQRRLNNLTTEIRQSLDLMSSSLYRDIEHARTDVAVMMATEVRQQVEAALAAAAAAQPKLLPSTEPVVDPSDSGGSTSSSSGGCTSSLLRAFQERLTSMEKELAEVAQEIADVCRAADMTTESVELLTKHLQALDEGQRDTQRHLSELQEQQQRAAAKPAQGAVQDPDAANAGGVGPAPDSAGSGTGARPGSSAGDEEGAGAGMDEEVVPPARPNTQAHGARDPDLAVVLGELSAQLAAIQAQNLHERIEAAERALRESPSVARPSTASAPPQPAAVPKELQSLLLELSGQVDSVLRVVHEQEHGLDVLAQVAEAATSSSRNAATRLDVVEASLSALSAVVQGSELPSAVVHGSIMRSRVGTAAAADSRNDDDGGLGTTPSAAAVGLVSGPPSRHASQHGSRLAVTFGPEALWEETRSSVTEMEGRLAEAEGRLTEVEKGLQVRGAAMATLSQQFDETARRLEALDARLSDVAMDAAAAAAAGGSGGGAAAGGAAAKPRRSDGGGDGVADMEYEESPDSYDALEVNGGGSSGRSGVVGGLGKMEQEWQARLKAAMKVLQDKMVSDRDKAQAEAGELRKVVARLKEKSVLIDEVILKLARRLDKLAQRVHDMLEAEEAETMTSYSAIDRDRLRTEASRSLARSESGSNYQDGVDTPAGSMPPSRVVSRTNSVSAGAGTGR